MQRDIRLITIIIFLIGVVSTVISLIPIIHAGMEIDIDREWILQLLYVFSNIFLCVGCVYYFLSPANRLLIVFILLVLCLIFNMVLFKYGLAFLEGLLFIGLYGCKKHRTNE